VSQSGNLPVFVFTQQPKINILPLVEKLNWIEIWLASFRMGTTCSTAMQNLGEIEQRAPAVGAKMWCCFFSVTVRSGGLCVRRVHSSNGHCVSVYGSILMQFPMFFFTVDSPFRSATQFSFSSLDGHRHNIRA